jgi:hypothetical protein
MTGKQIHYKRQRIKEKINNLHVELVKLQNICPHNKDRVISSHHNDDDGYSKRKITYYTDNFCLDCNARWMEEVE